MLNIQSIVIVFTPIALLVIITMISLIMAISNRRKFKRLNEKYNLFMSGVPGINIGDSLETCIKNIQDIKIKDKEFENKLNHLERNMLQCIQKVGVIRYSAFENVGSDLSFAIALLDSYDTGIIINGIYSRESSSVYAKQVLSGASKHTLSAEEMQALDLAKKAHRERPYTA